MKEYLVKYKIYILILILIISIVSIYFFVNNKEIKEEKNIVEEIKIENNEQIEEKVSVIKVDIRGNIKNPGVYEMKDNDRVIDVINIAGGLTKNADTTLINLSKKITDEMVIKIYSKEEVKKINEKEVIVEYIEKECNCENVKNDACIDNSESNIENKKISINNASLEELDSLPGIGTSKAKDIIDFREKNGLFKQIEDIKNVSGIGESLFEKIKDYISI